MHNLVNTLYAKRLQLETIIAGLPNQENLKSVNNEAALLVKKMKDWDEEMIQRKSTAYDDVENFPNKFTADYMFAMNHIQSEIPILSAPSVERITELNATWEGLKKGGEDLLNNQIPAINQLFWKAGIGAVWNK